MNRDLSKVIKIAKEFAYKQSHEYKLPPVFYLELVNDKGQELAEKLHADKETVLLGTLLLDCMLGFTVKEGKIGEHVERSALKVEELLSQFPEIDEKTKENILQCVRQHHGVNEFYSKEAEICCNADCYKFISVAGFIGGIQNNSDMNLQEMIAFYTQKAEEKWNALTLEVCKKELEPQYKAIKTTLLSYK